MFRYRVGQVWWGSGGVGGVVLIKLVDRQLFSSYKLNVFLCVQKSK